jgi:poly-gamma-glutamate synthesis protein (capsule biosynthesis protein)
MVAPFVFAAAGDAIITRRVAQKSDPAFTAMVDLIRRADAAFVNLEVVTPRQPRVPSAEHGGSNLGAEEFVLDELRWMGFNLYSVANNHSNDYTFHGLIDTMDALREREMIFAGGGLNLGEARSPGYLDTADARVAVLAASASYVVGAPAGPSREDMPGRPGISPLRVDYEYVLDERRMRMLDDIDEALGTAAMARQRMANGRAPQAPGAQDFLGLRFAIGDAPGVRERVDDRDLDDICRWINDAKRQAEFVVMSLHAHQGKGRRGNNPEMADFLPGVAHRFIDAGADVVVGHGPHMLRAIEVYHGKPIFYSLGDFYYVSCGIQRYPAEIYRNLGLPETATPADVQDFNNQDKDGNPRGFAADERFWQSVIPVCEYEDGELKSLVLHPIDLDFRATHRVRRGEPRLSDPVTGADILDQLAKLSQPFGIKIEVTPGGPDDRHVVGRVRW